MVTVCEVPYGDDPVTVGVADQENVQDVESEVTLEEITDAGESDEAASETGESDEARLQELEDAEKRKMEFCAKVASLQKSREELRFEYSVIGKEIKQFTEDIERLVREYIAAEAVPPLFDWREKQAGTEEPASPDAWKQWSVGEWFELTPAQYGKLGLEPISPVGKLADLVDSLSRGQKIAGVGPALIEKISDQFEKLWASPQYKALASGEAAETGEADAPEVLSESDEPDLEEDEA